MLAVRQRIFVERDPVALYKRLQRDGRSQLWCCAILQGQGNSRLHHAPWVNMPDDKSWVFELQSCGLSQIYNLARLLWLSPSQTEKTTKDYRVCERPNWDSEECKEKVWVCRPNGEEKAVESQQTDWGFVVLVVQAARVKPRRCGPIWYSFHFSF